MLIRMHYLLPGLLSCRRYFFISNSNEDPEVKSTQSQSEEKELLLISDSQLHV